MRRALSKSLSEIAIGAALEDDYRYNIAICFGVVLSFVLKEIPNLRFGSLEGWQSLPRLFLYGLRLTAEAAS
jgi:hypothetical protein